MPVGDKDRLNGEALRTIREELGWSRSRLAVELGYSAKSASIGAWESGVRNPRPIVITAIAAVFGVPRELLVAPVVRPVLSEQELAEESAFLGSIAAFEAELAEQDRQAEMERRGPAWEALARENLSQQRMDDPAWQERADATWRKLAEENKARRERSKRTARPSPRQGTA